MDQSEPMMSKPVEPDKRIVLEWITGPLAGLQQILGLAKSDWPEPVLDAALAKVTPRAIYYKEVEGE